MVVEGSQTGSSREASAITLLTSLLLPSNELPQTVMSLPFSLFRFKSYGLEIPTILLRIERQLSVNPRAISLSSYPKLHS